jgi:hypothetical protein
VSAHAYLLGEKDARWLADRLRGTYSGLTTSEAETAHQLAWALELALEGEGSPLELGLPHVEPVLHVVHTEDLPPSPRLIALQDALRRLQVEQS